MYRLLFVDDEALIRVGVSENVHWHQYGYELAGSCENGKEALEFIRSSPVDIVITDIGMPYMNGLELSERLKEEYPEIKIIILSGYDDFDYAKKAIRYGVRDYLLKPITAQELGEVLDRLRQEMDKEREIKKNISLMRAASHKGQLLLYSDALYNLITGNKTMSESRHDLNEAGINLAAAVFCVAVVRFAPVIKVDIALMSFILHNISQEIISGYQGGVVCQGKDAEVYLLFMSDKLGELQRIIDVVCEEIIVQMNRAAHLKVNIGMGGLKEQLGDIPRSYEEAEEAYAYHYISDQNQVLKIKEIRAKKKPAAVEEAIKTLMLHMRENDNRKMTEDIAALAAILRSSFYDRQSAGTVLQRIVDAADEILKRSEIKEIPENLNKESVLQRILSAVSLPAAFTVLTVYCRELAECLDRQRSPVNRKVVDLAMDYIEKNHADCELNLNAVCSYLNISPSRFSAIFKAATDTTFLEVLNGIRMQKAKDLLIHTDMKNYEIAGRVGFNDPHYFGIAFKKFTGKTPTEYARDEKANKFTQRT